MGIDASQVALVIPTRGDVPLDEIIEAYSGLGFALGYVWNNSMDDDLGVYGRYAAIEKVDAPIVVTQDDDCVLPPASIQALLDNYEPGVLTANLPAKFHERYKDRGTCLVGFGAIFDRNLPEQAFAKFFHDARVGDAYARAAHYTSAAQAQFLRTCDLVFAGLTPHRTLDLAYEDLPWARDESRMWRQPGHFEERLEMLNLVRSVRDGVTA